ncbi:MAG: hybrid sensor histidine kinase/response regulator [Planctomycetes bacterium]|nr:hybrid sensor histidine kinase/response regulator [Planctomycetota bacterium]
MDERGELLQGYQEESEGHLRNLEGMLTALQDGAASKDDINLAFRCIHTIKGGAGFFQLTKISELGHCMEDLLGKFREGSQQPTKENVEALIGGLDLIVEMFDDLGASNEVDIVDAKERILMILEGRTEGHAQKTEEASPATAEVTSTPSVAQQKAVPEVAQEGHHPFLLERELLPGTYWLRVQLDIQPWSTVLNELSSTGTILQMIPEEINEKDVEVDILFHTLLSESMLGALEVKYKSIKQLSGIIGENTAVAGSSDPSSEIKGESGNENLKPPAKVVAETAVKDKKVNASIRVEFNHLSKLIDLSSELVLSRNQFARELNPKMLHAFNNISTQINELQDGLMRTRMQPLSLVTDTFSRLVRTLAKKLNKMVKLEIYGSEVELDRTIIEGMSAPFTHILRNCLDHGIESPEVRACNGKSKTGRITIRAQQKAGLIMIEVKDDGKGIDPKVIMETAIRKGLLTEEDVEGMSYKQIISYLFTPGFSTAKEVTDVSGRGVGMDVVRTSFREMGGSVDMESKVGEGTTLTIQLPLAVAIINSLVIRVEDQLYAVPRNTICEVVKLSKKEPHQLDRVGNQDVLRFRGSLLPVVRLADVLRIPRTYTDQDEHAEDRREKIADRRSSSTDRKSGNIIDMRSQQNRRRNQELIILVLSIGAMEYGLIVDSVSHQEETIVKPLNETIQHIRHFMGITILSSGEVCFILNGQGLGEKASIRFDALKEDTRAAPRKPGKGMAGETEHEPHLIIKGGKGERFSLLVGLVQSTALVHRRQVMSAKDQQFITLNGVDYQLFFLHKHISVSEIELLDDFYVVLPKHIRSKIAIVCHRIEGIKMVPSQLEHVGEKEHGKVATVVFENELMTILDLYALEAKSNPAIVEKALPGTQSIEGKKVLLVEDTAMFRNIVSGHLKGLGLVVETAVDGEKGLSKLEVGEYDLVVSDIEMPNLDGYGMIVQIRENPRFANLPVIALTTLSSMESRQKGMDLGFSDYLEKIHRESFRECIVKHLSRTT